jgi:hypothetical protein
MTRKFGVLTSLVVLLVGFLGCSVDTPTAPDQVPAPPPTTGGNNWNISVSVEPDELEADSEVPAAVSVRITSRADGTNPPNGTTMTLSTTLGVFGASDSEQTSVGVIINRGRASALLFAGSVAAGGTVTARLEGSQGRANFQVLGAVDPFILSVSPNEGPESGGTVVTITGTGFSEVSRVFFGDKLGTVTSITSDRITVITPPADILGSACDSNGDGTQDGQVKQDKSVGIKVEAANGGSETLANAFTYRVAQPGVCVPN